LLAQVTSAIFNAYLPFLLAYVFLLKQHQIIPGQFQATTTDELSQPIRDNCPQVAETQPQHVNMADAEAQRHMSLIPYTSDSQEIVL
jgi:hypothetical protein